MNFKLTGEKKLLATLGKLKQNLREDVRQSLGVVGLAILEDTIHQEPKPPYETGYLRGAQFMYVLGALQKVPGAKKSGGSGKEKYINDPPPTVSTEAGTFTLEVGLNTPYAKYQHEELGFSIFPTQFSKRGTVKDTQGVSGKFLELKLLRNKEEYAMIFAREMTQRMKNSGK